MKFATTLFCITVLISGCNCNQHPNQLNFSDTVEIKNDLLKITQTPKYRNYQNPETLDSIASYIFDKLRKTCDTVYYQPFEVNGITYKNVIGISGIHKNGRIVVGAHYDVAGDQEGADDNASGVAGLLQLARIVSKHPIDRRIDFVAFTLEEPPFFRTTNMGSYIHAKSLSDNHEKIEGMICLEMIGYYSDAPHSQTYPLKIPSLFYGNKGNFITVVQKRGNGEFGRKIKRNMKRISVIPTKSFKGPASLPGIDFSDHLNYWKFGYSAVMITNTSFYRNKNYHQPTDKLATLNIKKLGLVVDEVYLAIANL